MFSVTMPRAANIARLAPADPGRAAQPAILDGLVVIAIDNEPTILEGMQLLVGGWGARVIVAASLDAAIENLRAENVAPDVIVADYHLDDGDGMEAIAGLRARFGEATPAILLTADRTPSLREEATERDVRVLNKPLKPAALRALLSQWRALKGAAE